MEMVEHVLDLIKSMLQQGSRQNCGVWKLCCPEQGERKAGTQEPEKRNCHYAQTRGDLPTEPTL